MEVDSRTLLFYIAWGLTPTMTIKLTGKEASLIQTIPVKGWYIGLRLCGPERAWFDKNWHPGEIEINQ